MDLFVGHAGRGERGVGRLDHQRGPTHVDIGAFVEHADFGRGEIDRDPPFWQLDFNTSPAHSAAVSTVVPESQEMVDSSPSLVTRTTS